MQRELGITFVHVTHTQMEAIALADMVVVMEHGKIRQAGPAREVYSRPKDRYVAEFLGGQNVLRGEVARVNGGIAVVDLADCSSIVVPLEGRPGVRRGDAVDLAVRRDDIRLLRTDGAVSEAGANVLRGWIEAMEYQGAYVKVLVRTPLSGDFFAYVAEREYLKDPFEVRAAVLATWSAEDCRLLA